MGIAVCKEYNMLYPETLDWSVEKVPKKHFNREKIKSTEEGSLVR